MKRITKEPSEKEFQLPGSCRWRCTEWLRNEKPHQQRRRITTHLLFLSQLLLGAEGKTSDAASAKPLKDVVPDSGGSTPAAEGPPRIRVALPYLMSANEELIRVREELQLYNARNADALSFEKIAPAQVDTEKMDDERPAEQEEEDDDALVVRANQQSAALWENLRARELLRQKSSDSQARRSRKQDISDAVGRLVRESSVRGGGGPSAVTLSIPSASLQKERSVDFDSILKSLHRILQ